MVGNTHEETHRLIAKQILVRASSKIAFQCFVNLWFCFGVGEYTNLFFLRIYAALYPDGLLHTIN